DRVFLVSFDSHVRLIRAAVDPGEAAVRAVEEGLGEIEPEGSTALYDSVGFSLLRFLAGAAHDAAAGGGTETPPRPERRALVVITDGADMGSHIEPKRAVELAVEHGIPVYVVAIPRLDVGRGRAGSQLLSQGAAGADLRLLTDPTGGRVLRAGRGGGLERAFAQIAAELRHQLVLTFATDTDPERIAPRGIEVSLPGREALEVRAVVPLDRIR
ncbi:MAG: hypothetical protein MI919_31520, partial [Holophagales bacterium]|nr:hypothetical protein [Holophagales bacterium]